MKKILSILLCVALMMGVVGCSENENNNVNATSNKINETNKNENTEENDKEQPKDEALVKKAEEQLGKDIEESKKKYADYINEIRNLYPSVKIEYIIQSRDDIGNYLEGKTMVISMDVIESNEKTCDKYFEFTVEEKSNLEDKNITSITVFFYNEMDIKGMMICNLEDIGYVPVVNTLE